MVFKKSVKKNPIVGAGTSTPLPCEIQIDFKQGKVKEED